ncbi:Alginate lyase [Porphyromonadaceae bacterium NLAE-zl-C104]|nr:Alginate lyase [Porphyromonadaceae bacterium NLAE-zl-C104]
MKKLYIYIILLLSIGTISCEDTPEAKRSAQVETLEVVDITDFSAMCRGRIIDEGSGTVSRYGIELDGGSGYVKHFRTEISGNNFGVQLTGLSQNTLYRYRAYIDDGTVQYGEEKQFTTQSGVQFSASIDPISITRNSAIVDFTSVVDRSKEWGVYYSESEATTGDPVKKESSQASIIIEGLKNNTTYHILPYVVSNNSETFFLEKSSFTTTDNSGNSGPDVHNMHPISQLRHVKYQVVKRVEPFLTAYNRAISDADLSIDLEQQEKAMSDFYVPGYYGNEKAHRAAAKNLTDDSYGAYVNALAFRLSGDKKYAEKAVYFLNAWSNKNTTYSGPDGALTMTRAGSGLVIAAELMTGTKEWSAAERNQFSHWVINVYQRAGNSIRNRQNNWADWGRYASILSASFTENRAAANENIRLMKSDLFVKIAPDGHMPEEVPRGVTGTWYTYFSLSPLTASAWIANNITGENLFALESGEGASIKKAVDYILYYSINPSEWPWYDNPERGTPNKWPGNLVEALYGIYKDQSYISYVSGSRPIVYNDHHFTWTFPTLMPLSLTGYE